MKKNNARLSLLLGAMVFIVSSSNAQNTSQNSFQQFWAASDTLNKKRVHVATGAAIGAYTLTAVGLYNSWYKKDDLGKFHLFDDALEWKGMDKYGHFYSSYLEAMLAYRSAKWAGMSDKKAVNVAYITGGIVQSTIEIMDGFSTKWGFSITDVAMNFAGLAGFGLQQKYWGEQRISFKVSSWSREYDKSLIQSIDGLASSSLNERSNNLFGTTFLGRYLKDYNAQTYWASINIASFLPSTTKMPNYINIALGYGAENMFGGFENAWDYKGHHYVLDVNEYERYHQFYLGLDLDLTKIKTKNSFVKSLLTVFNNFKVPAPAVEFNSKGEVIFHLVKI